MTAILALLGRLPILLWPLLAVVAFAGWQHWCLGQAVEREAEATQRATAAEANAAAQAAARASEAAMNEATRKAADAYRARLAQTRRDADSVRDERDRLLVAVDAAPAACPAGEGASAPGRVDGAANLRIVVRECVAALQEVAAAADVVEGRLSGLQDYVRAIGAAKP